MRPARLLLVLALASSTSALAIAVGGTLYIKTKDTPLLKEPKAKSAKVATLQPGEAVVWKGPSAKNKDFHEVQAGEKKGFVMRGDLTPNKPQLELDASSGQPMSPPAFAQSGAANKSPRPSTHGQSPALQSAAAELIYVEALNQAKATPQAIELKSQALHSP